MKGKKACKKALQQICKLPEKDVPLLSVITRLSEQKGLDLIEKLMDTLLQEDIQFVLLGTGKKRYNDLFKKIGLENPERTSINIDFDNALAHQIEAGSDIFLMPSRFEPCGLNQMMSLKYGTVPIVRRTGGLADTVLEYDPKTRAGNGFVFEEMKGEDFSKAVNRALKLYADPDHWQQIVENGMRADFSWEASAEKYLQLYQRALKIVKN